VSDGASLDLSWAATRHRALPYVRDRSRPPGSRWGSATARPPVQTV